MCLAKPSFPTPTSLPAPVRVWPDQRNRQGQTVKLVNAVELADLTREATDKPTIILGIRGDQVVMGASLTTTSDPQHNMALAASITRGFETDITALACTIPNEQTLALGVNKALDVHVTHHNPHSQPKASRTLNEYETETSQLLEAMASGSLLLQAQRDLRELQDVQGFTRLQALLDTAAIRYLEAAYPESDLRISLLGDIERKQELEYVQRTYVQ